jgi:hypothetical protein
MQRPGRGHPPHHLELRVPEGRRQVSQAAGVARVHLQEVNVRGGQALTGWLVGAKI